MLFEDQLNLVSSSKTILEETISSYSISWVLPTLFAWNHYNLKSNSLFCDTFFPGVLHLPGRFYYDLTLALFELRSSHSSISLSFNTLFSGLVSLLRDWIASSSWSLLPLSILSTRALSTQLYQHHFPDSSASQRLLATITQCLGFPYSVRLLVSLKRKVVCVHVYIFVLLYSLRQKSRFWANLPRSYQKFCQQLLRKPIPRPSVTRASVSNSSYPHQSIPILVSGDVQL